MGQTHNVAKSYVTVTAQRI